MQGESKARSEQMVMKEWEVYRLGTTGRSVEKNKRGISRKKQKEGRAAAEAGQHVLYGRRRTSSCSCWLTCIVLQEKGEQLQQLANLYCIEEG